MVDVILVYRHNSVENHSLIGSFRLILECIKSFRVKID